MLLAAAANTTRILLLAVSTATARLVHFPAFWALHWRELPVGSTFRSPPASGMLMRSMVPGAAAPWAAGPQIPELPAASARADRSAIVRGRCSNPEDRNRLMSEVDLSANPLATCATT